MKRGGFLSGANLQNMRRLWLAVGGCSAISSGRAQSRFLICATFLSAWLSAGVVFAQPGRHLEALSWDRNVAGLVRKYCYKCHNNETMKGGVDLARDVNPRLILKNRETWDNARDMLENDLMPPRKARQPTAEERKVLIEFLKKTLDQIECSSLQNPGPPPLRRLNRVEYNNTIADLTGLDLHPADGFSPDPSSFGFDTIGETLQFSPAQVEQYHKAAQDIVQAVLDSRRKPTPRHPLWQVDLDSKSVLRATARDVVSRFATRAFRRPVEPEYIDRLMKIYDLAVSRGDSPKEAVGSVFTAILISPRFLIRLEAATPDQTEPYLVDDYELASRLSYFLWSRPPDEQLLKRAAEGNLSDLQVLKAETQRMLADPRSQALADQFFGQWLEIGRIHSHHPDAEVFPEYNSGIQKAILAEVRMLLAEIVQKNRPIHELIDADYTYLNQSLADWYGISGVQGAEMRRVGLTDHRRGGILTTAAVLMLQSDPGRTNIPRRGNYLAGRILGDAAPPPPPDIPELEAVTAGGKVLTVRERLEIHRQKPECASCHSRIDPLGFSLENYDALGRWRKTEAGRPIDPSGQLSDGQTLSGPLELKKILLERKEAFTRTLIQNLLIYALGRSLQPEDECVVREALTVAKSNDGRFGELVISIVGSTPFRYRRNADY